MGINNKHYKTKANRGVVYRKKVNEHIKKEIELRKKEEAKAEKERMLTLKRNLKTKRDSKIKKNSKEMIKKANIIMCSLLIILVISYILIANYLYDSNIFKDKNLKFIIPALSLVLGLFLKSVLKFSLDILTDYSEEPPKMIKDMLKFFDYAADLFIGSTMIIILLKIKDPHINIIGFFLIPLCAAVVIFASPKSKTKNERLKTRMKKTRKRFYVISGSFILLTFISCVFLICVSNNSDNSTNQFLLSTVATIVLGSFLKSSHEICINTATNNELYTKNEKKLINLYPHFNNFVVGATIIIIIWKLNLNNKIAVISFIVLILVFIIHVASASLKNKGMDKSKYETKKKETSK